MGCRLHQVKVAGHGFSHDLSFPLSNCTFLIISKSQSRYSILSFFFFSNTSQSRCMTFNEWKLDPFPYNTSFEFKTLSYSLLLNSLLVQMLINRSSAAVFQYFYLNRESNICLFWSGNKAATDIKSIWGKILNTITFLY